jgi:hypothetical protein
VQQLAALEEEVVRSVEEAVAAKVGSQQWY